MASFFTVRPALSAINSVWQSRSGVLLFFFFPLLVVFAQGQDSMISLLLYCLAWRQLEAGTGPERGMSCWRLLSLNSSSPFRSPFSLPSGAAVASPADSFSRLAAILLVCVFDSWARRARLSSSPHVRSDLRRSDKSLVAQNIEACIPRAMPNLAGLIYACGGRFLPSSHRFQLLSGLCSLAVFAWCARAVRRVDDQDSVRYRRCCAASWSAIISASMT